MAGARAAVRPAAVLQWAHVRLRPLTEAECYARCYGRREEGTVQVLRGGAGQAEPAAGVEAAAAGGEQAGEREAA